MLPLIAALLFALPLSVLPGNDNISALPQSALLQTGVPLLWMRRLRAPGAVRARPRFLTPLALFLAWSAVSAFLAPDRFAAVQRFSDWFAAAGLLVLVFFEVRTLAAARVILLALFSSSVVVSGLGLLQALGGFEGIPQVLPPAATLANKNVAAGFVAVLLPIGVMAAWSASTQLRSILFALASGVCLGYVAQADCRGAVVALSVEAIVAIVLVPWRGATPAAPVPRLGSLAAGLGLAVLLSLFPSFEARSAAAEAGGEAAHRDSQAARSERGARSVQIRLGVWRNALEMIRESPVLGAGLGAFKVQYPIFARHGAPDGTTVEERVESAHNDYIQGVAELGALGAALVLWFLGAWARVARTGGRGVAAERGIVITALLPCAGLSIEALFSPTWSHPALLMTAAALGGVATAFSREPAPVPRRSPGALALNPALAVATGLAILAGVNGVRAIAADRHGLRMAEAASRGDWARAAEEGRAARSWNPNRVDLRFGEGTALLRLGRPGEAAEVLAALTEIDRFNASALGNLAIAFERAGEPARAAELFARILDLRPADEGAQRGLLRVAALSPLRVAR